jgi:hypothetical protein
MFFELRQYRLKPGQRDRWVKFMEEVIVPYQQSKGMVVVGNFIALQEDDLYIWIRRFESEEERERQYKAVYDTDYWRSLKPQLDEMLDRERMVITRLEPTPKSIIR